MLLRLMLPAGSSCPLRARPPPAPGIMITAFHPYSTVEVPFVPILVSVSGEKLSVAGEKRNACCHWGHWGEVPAWTESAASA
jgi:hypothetical protein